eukprot:scaffold626_cov409-Prasinococcus_capsulatus_cf.AAC.4
MRAPPPPLLAMAAGAAAWWSRRPGRAARRVRVRVGREAGGSVRSLHQPQCRERFGAQVRCTSLTCGGGRCVVAAAALRPTRADLPASPSWRRAPPSPSPALWGTWARRPCVEGLGCASMYGLPLGGTQRGFNAELCPSGL